MKKNACGKTHKVIIIIDTLANEKYPSWKNSSWKMQGVITSLTGSFKILDHNLDVSQFSLFYTLHFTQKNSLVHFDREIHLLYYLIARIESYNYIAQYSAFRNFSTEICIKII